MRGDKEDFERQQQLLIIQLPDTTLPPANCVNMSHGNMGLCSTPYGTNWCTGFCDPTYDGGSIGGVMYGCKACRVHLCIDCVPRAQEARRQWMPPPKEAAKVAAAIAAKAAKDASDTEDLVSETTAWAERAEAEGVGHWPSEIEPTELQGGELTNKHTQRIYAQATTCPGN